MNRTEVWPGCPHPLGASFTGDGVNFAVYSERATAMDVCLFDGADPTVEIARLVLPERSAGVWSGFVPGLKPGALYGFRAHGPYEPERGLRFNPHKLLVDPYARAVFGKVDWRHWPYGFGKRGEDPDLVAHPGDDAPGVPKSVVLDGRFQWGDDRRPQTPWEKTVLYELHVRGFSRLNPRVPKELQGTFAGLAHPASIEHLLKVGATAVELLPVHESVSDKFLPDRGLTNYWGYATLGFFAPDQRFSSQGGRGGQVGDFKAMVKALHAAGIEVILDVVYNHTGEAGPKGPSLSLRGLDNPTYYLLQAADPHEYVDYTGCGNTLNLRHPQTLKLVCDSLRYWAEEMRVDGFRFDLAPALCRDREAFDRQAAFLKVLHQDPVLSQRKLIAEPWDLGPGGYQLANFPAPWAEWNDKYRDTLRRFWRGDKGQVSDLGCRLAGSSDLFFLSGRRPQHSINYVVSHDGFTLHDLVSYTKKHNQANGEDNRDGPDENYASNSGVEGETDDPVVLGARERKKRSLLASLLLSQGVPMLCAGDEVGRTQRGNNNAYCQDNELSWLCWNWDERQRALLEFTSRMIRLRQSHATLQRRHFFRGEHLWDSRRKDLAWFRPDGKEMTPDDWKPPDVHAIAFLVDGDSLPPEAPVTARGSAESLLVLLNARPDPVSFVLPPEEWGREWLLLVDTAAEGPVAQVRCAARSTVEVQGGSLMVLGHDRRSRGRP